MNKFLATFLLAAAMLPAFSRLDAEPAKPSPQPAARAAAGPLTFDTFRLVHTRNVFDPDRRPVRPVVGAPASAPAPTRADYAALTGIMLSDDKTYAFFSGSRPEFNRVLTVQEKIANATITAVTAQNIEVEREGKRTVVAVGQTVPLDNQSAPGAPPVEASVSATSVDGAVSGSAPATTPPPTYYARRPAVAGIATSAAPRTAPANIDEIRRRMMEKRQQELK